MSGATVERSRLMAALELSAAPSESPGMELAA
jgi:hypothetical protein